MNTKPREKLAAFGPEKLENHELLEIILSKGTKKESVFTMGKRLFENYDLEELLNLKDPVKFVEAFQTGFVQACQIVATFEIGKRFFSKNLPATSLRNPQEVYEKVKDMRHYKKEFARGLYVNSRYRLIHDETIAIGSLDANIIHPREIFRPAFEYSAYGLILVHNHPTGDATPSQNDIDVTKKLIEVGDLLQIPLLEHLIVGENSYSTLNKRNIDSF